MEGNQGRLSPGSQGKKEFQEGGGVGGQQGDTLQGCHLGETSSERAMGLAMGGCEDLGWSVSLRQW